jgi:hypothetical protein
MYSLRNYYLQCIEYYICCSFVDQDNKLYNIRGIYFKLELALLQPVTVGLLTVSPVQTARW